MSCLGVVGGGFVVHSTPRNVTNNDLSNNIHDEVLITSYYSLHNKYSCHLDNCYYEESVCGR